MTQFSGTGLVRVFGLSPEENTLVFVPTGGSVSTCVELLTPDSGDVGGLRLFAEQDVAAVVSL